MKHRACSTLHKHEDTNQRKRRKELSEGKMMLIGCSIGLGWVIFSIAWGHALGAF